MAELIQAMKVYYLTVERFLTSNPLLLNLRCMVGYIVREHGIYCETMTVCSIRK